MLKKISKIAIACLFLSFILGSFNFVGIKTVNATVNFNPNVTIPGSDFKHEEPNKDKPDKKLGTQLSKSTKPIADYMKALYNWGIGVVGVLAGVVLVIAGIIWLTAGGNNTQVEMAKKWIAGSLSGLVLALGSYFLLHQINPDLVSFKYYTIEGVEVGGKGESDFVKNMQKTCSWEAVGVVGVGGSCSPEHVDATKSNPEYCGGVSSIAGGKESGGVVYIENGDTKIQYLCCCGKNQDDTEE